ncbi:type II/IV secretion system family protein [Yersinia ruckeri ATCC 29473]|uniref:Protein with nucleoside triphosphate hydrolase domain n=2 Tax=Yersinia ruckeri TaxID=29486 RepID=A0A380QND4_YERRU|nr:type II/IV secretion system family protein [Yersinia ruckeri ATCC 29473]CNI09919.1 protein with nucleoside triphosphate hydrolase domain [Yersinia ruckeri]SUP96426.1 protein with nucleoside triphosphate hydrolase domain [Yersinia ruckeri]SUQ00171.1 protein with nucleoside triphosphate hydrolase domain [Yersinia ruckeri]
MPVNPYSLLKIHKTAMHKNNLTNNGEAGDELSRLCLHYQAVPLKINQNVLTVAMLQHPNIEVINTLSFACGLKIEVVLWPAAKIEQHLHHAQPGTHFIKSDVDTELQVTEQAENHPPDLKKTESHQFDGQNITTLNHESDIPVVRFIYQTLRAAIQKRASDIHFEPYQHHYRIRLRIDGILHPIISPPPSLINRISACLKVMAKLNSAERRLPQDGQLNLNLDKQNYSLRIATLPTQYGEKIVLRILDSHQQQKLQYLGLTPDALKTLQEALTLPQGLILVTGPTGSGKTVTLYSCLSYLNQQCRNICSVEDPIEITVDGINQTQTNRKIDLDFALTLRALLRQDPDVIMIGEIRDDETANIAVRAALTGHLVLSTLHTNSTRETLSRLAQMGVRHHLLASCLKLTVAQRLVRRLCQQCKQRASQPVTLLPSVWTEPLSHWQATGCEHCNGGYYGRTGIYEMLPITGSIQKILAQGGNLESSVCTDFIRENDTLLNAGLNAVREGITSLDEISRVFGHLSQLKADI